MERPTTDHAEAVIFVDLTGDAADFYVAPADWVRNDIRRHHETWLAGVGGTRPRNPESRHHAIPVDRVRAWHRRWDVLAG